MFIEGSASTTAATTGTFSANAPGTHSNGSLQVAVQACVIPAAGAAPVTPTGWILKDSITTASLYDLRIYYKVASGEPATYTFNNSTGSGSPVSHVWIVSINGAASIIETSSTNANAGGSTTATALSITPFVGNELLFGAFQIGLNSSGTITPNGFDSDFGTLSDASNCLDLAQQVLPPGVAPTGNRTAALSASLIWNAMLFCVAPAGSPPPPSSGGGGPEPSGDVTGGLFGFRNRPVFYPRKSGIRSGRRAPGR